MKFSKRWIAALLVIVIGVAAYSTRADVARTNPCAVVYYSFDDGPFTFSHTYRSGRVGPFTVGQPKEDAISALSTYGMPFILPMTMTKAQSEQFYLTHNTVVSSPMRALLEFSDEWSVGVESCGEAHAIYTPTFDEGRLESVRLFNSALQGL